jgi:hypothetical protein
MMQENVKQNRIKKILFSIAILLLIVPMIQQNLNIFEFKPLRGAYEKPAKKTLNWKTWFTEEYQRGTQKYIDQNLGFHSFLVRLYNQMQYSLYNKARVDHVVVGKENYLYQKSYIRAYTGRDFVGEEVIEEKVSKLKLIRDSLSNYGVELVVVLAPGKGSFYPEYIPDKFNPHQRTITNYEYYRDQLASESINTVDFHKWFREMKDTISYPLFPKTGIHWSKYGEYLALDSLLAYISEIYDGYVPDLKLKKIELSDEMRYTDDDIERGMNLIFNISDLKMAYPEFEFDSYEGNSLKILSIGDSYFNMIFKTGLKREVFSGSQYWYYNKTIEKTYKDELEYVKSKDLLLEVLNTNILVLINTDGTLKRFSFGFIDNLYYEFTVKRKRVLKFLRRLKELNKFEDFHQHFQSSDSLVEAAGYLFEIEKDYLKQLKIENVVRKIKNSPKWLKSLEEKALKKNISLEKEILINAEYAINKELDDKLMKEICIADLFNDPKIINIDSSYLSKLIDLVNIDFYVKKIKKSPKWVKSIEKQAIEWNTTIDEAIRRNAKYIVKQKQKKKPHLMQGS